jgi:hypothetical protein
MFSYYGSKTSIVSLYPPPKHDLIIEPFAGAAKYALKYWDRDVLLVDKYDVIIKIWKWLQQCSEKDILSLPVLERSEKIRDFKLDCEEAYLFMGFVIATGGQRPRNTASPTATTQRPGRIATRLKKVASELYKIKHWKIENKDYKEIENVNATWFVDPPYQVGGDVYVQSNKNIDFDFLKEWCVSRNGQVIVCENTMATWMNFNPIKVVKGSTRKTTEAIWTNEISNYTNPQLSLL